MSEPVSNAEIEDVLSSIRRLVSQEVRPPVDANREGPAPRFRHRGKLVLTPAFRVPEARDARDEAPQPEAETAASAALDTAGPQVGAAAKTPEAKAPQGAVEIAEMIMAGAGMAAQPEAPAADCTPEDGGEVGGEVGGEDGPEDSPEDSLENDAESVASAQVRLERTIVELEAAIGAQNTDWEPDGSEQEGANESVPPALNTPPPREEPQTPQEPQAEHDSAPAPEAPPEAAPAEAGEEIPGPAPRPAAQVPEDEAEDAVEDMVENMAEDVTGTMAETMADPGPAVDDQAIPDAEIIDPDADFYDDETSVIDEETLRDMVSEIVRSELQGDLGQRITRNVRKLVRREIHRVLASRDFE